MSLANRVNLILRKLDDPDCAHVAEKEIRALIVNEIDNGEKLNMLINSIAEEKNYANKKTQYHALKLFVGIAEIFQHQILEFLPKVFAILNKRITSSDETVQDVIAEAYAGVIENSFKGAEPTDANYVFNECLKQIYELFDNKVKTVHICAGVCLSKMIQSCEISIIDHNFEDIYRDLTVVLKAAKEKYTVLEAILTLLLSVSNKVESIGEDVIDTILHYISDQNHKTRKICIDIIYAILSIDTTILQMYNDQIYKILQELKTDKNRFVREAAMECINLLSAPNKSNPADNHSRVKSATPKIPANSNNQKFTRKTSAKFVNKKMNLEHVTSTLDKAKINKAFAANNNNNNSFDMPVILVKEPKNIEEYQRMQQLTEENLIKFKSEQGIEEKKTNTKVSVKKPKNDGMIERKQSIESRENNQMQIEDTIDKVHMIEENQIKNIEEDQKRPIHIEEHDSTDKKEIENLKKYIKILNGKVKDLYTTCTHLTKVNNDLTGKVVALEQNYTHLYSLMQRGNYKSQDIFLNESTSNLNSKYATPDRGMPQMPQIPQIPQMSQIHMSNVLPNPSPMINTENNKWLNKTTNINTKLFNILAANNDDSFFNFLRDSSNYNNFNNIDNYLVDQLYSRLVDLLTKTANENSIVAEYALRWLHLFLDAGIPENERDSKKLQSLLYYLSNNLEDMFLKEKVAQLLDHDHFSNRADDFSTFSNTKRLKEES